MTGNREQDAEEEPSASEGKMETVGKSTGKEAVGKPTGKTLLLLDLFIFVQYKT